uniref:Saposin B-type domain-containing protein n=1 Tax=Timema cristinae TaxID=61476 RepID=A0A7R9CW24_TIMCR|nr:unnamed protein product [Timema cristinae]
MPGTPNRDSRHNLVTGNPVQHGCEALDHRCRYIHFPIQNVIDTESWVYNLTEANQNSNHAPKWFKLYSFKKDYHVSSLKPQDLDKMVHKMDKDDYLLQKHHSASINIVKEKAESLSYELRQSRVQGYHTDRLSQLVNKYSLPRHLQGVEPELLPEPYDDITCILCSAAVIEVLDIYNQNKSADALRSVAIQLCITFNLASEDVCIGIIDVHLAEAVYLANHADDASKKQLCGLYLSSCGFVDEWTIDVDLGTKPDIVTPTVPDSPTDTMTIVHITDMHFDPTYLVGGRGDCGEPTCCREEQGTPTDGTIAAGYWGDYRHCDTPAQAVNDTLLHIKQQHQSIDYVYMTGDFVDHGVWETSQETNTKTITAVVNAAKETFGDVPIIFTLGNHEPTPVNQYVPNKYAPLNVDDDVSSKWLYELVAELWSPYITDEAKQTILQGGFYTLLLQPGFRVIILNNVVGYKSNLFENIIMAQFNGHTHTDEFQVFHSMSNLTRANSVLFNGGSGTANANVNPNYRIYTVDPSSMYVLDAETWIYNLTDANLSPKINPKWFLEYSMREAFGVPTLLPQALSSLTHSMARDHALMRQYYR